MAQKEILSPLTPAEKERIFQVSGPTVLPLRLIGDCALTVEEASALRWEDVDLDAKTLSLSGRKVPISSETAVLLKEISWQGPYVLPAVRDARTPINRAALSRQVRQALDRAGFPHLDASSLRTLRILELLETSPIEEVSRATGYEVRSLRVLWDRNRKGPLPTRPRRTAARLDEADLLAALEKEGDTLAARAVWLSWQGGLTVKGMLPLTWKDISPSFRKWTVQGKSSQVPETLCPLLRRWRRADGGTGPILRGVSSQTVPEPAFLVRRVSEFFLREGLDSVTLASVRGRAGEKRLLEDLPSAPVTVSSLRRELGVSQTRAAEMVQTLTEQGRIPPDNRARFRAVLAAHQGGTVTTAALRQETGFAPGLLAYYIKEALASGTLRKERHGVYRCL
ncbi:hypothetical protein [Oscillibacter sp.]|uniref:hypothetical protein n=1 Tax=Oscillibacter sp. TaxID=1945593 RepID=UPI001B6ADDF5|nr:hypothetical protein [Oscillibacter sp.]MBP3509439.1 site-specific integrase [Oscillibacter sp.]